MQELDDLERAAGEQPAPLAYFPVAVACQMAGCTRRQFYSWLEKGWISIASERTGPISLSQSEVDDLRSFRRLMDLPQAQLARALLTARRALKDEQHTTRQLREQLRRDRKGGARARD